MAGLQTEDITFASNGGTARGFLARPDDGAAHPGVIVIQEWWGINHNIKDIAQRFAQAGFVALAPDLYHGKVTKEPDEAVKALMALDMGEVATELKGSLIALRGRADVAPKKIGVVGFCMGGRLALIFASQAGADLGAAVGFYPGGYEPTEADVAKIQAPVLAIYGGKDDSTPEDKREMFRKYLTDNGKTFDMLLYPGADHAFFNDDRPEVYAPQAATDAWQRVTDWFGRYLR